MKPHRWLGVMVLIILIGVIGAFGVNAVLDPYGLFRDTHQRRLVVYGDPRIAKYLLNQRYVPENFDAIFIGSSVTANWNMRGLDRLRVYNNSINGGNIVEEKAIVTGALSRPGIKIAFLLVHPALTASHEYRTVVLDGKLKWSALGSLSLWDAYKEMINVRLGRMRLMFDYAGTEDLGAYPREMNPNMKKLWVPGDRFEVDKEAYSAFVSLLDDLHARGIKIVFVVPPTSEKVLRPKRVAWDAYTALVHQQMRTGDEWIDFSTQEYASFRENPSHFGDGVHFEPEAAAQMVAFINDRLNKSAAESTIGSAALKASASNK